MGRGLGQAANGPNQFFAAQLPGLGDGLPLHQFGEQRGACQGGNTSLGEKPDLFYASRRHPQGEFQDIPAGRVFNLDRGVGIGDGAGVARILEVIEDLR